MSEKFKASTKSLFNDNGGGDSAQSPPLTSSMPVTSSSSSDSSPKKRPFSVSSFYGSGGRRQHSTRDLKRIRKLERAAKDVSDRKAADSLRCCNQSINQSTNEPSNPSGSGSKLLSSHPKYYQVFSKQSEALASAEARQDLKVFAFEVDFSGKRQFVCCHPLTLWAFYKHLKKRHYYEVIPPNKPCKLYFDLEFKRELNPDLDGRQLVQTFKSKLGEDLRQIYGENTQKSVDILDLDSTTSAKFSRHLIVTSHVFENLSQMRAYVQAFCEKLRQDSTFPKIRCFEEEGTDGSEGKNCQIFVDEGVYTKNRNFRLYMSSKFGKEATLQLALDDQDHLATNDRRRDSNSQQQQQSAFFDSLITNVNTIHLLQFYSPFEDPVHLPSSSSSATAAPRSSEVVAVGNSSCTSPFPEIDAFVVTLVNDLESGRTGYVRKWSMCLNGRFLTFDIGGSFKFCGNVGRHHKSNNIKYVVDVEKGNYFQTCHDTECKEFRSNVLPLPASAQPWLSMFDDEA